MLKHGELWIHLYTQKGIVYLYIWKNLKMTILFIKLESNKISPHYINLLKLSQTIAVIRSNLLEMKIDYCIFLNTKIYKQIQIKAINKYIYYLLYIKKPLKSH